jgi:hypothetical protein
MTRFNRQFACHATPPLPPALTHSFLLVRLSVHWVLMRSICPLSPAQTPTLLAPRRLINAQSVDHVLGQPHGHDEGRRQETASSTVRRSSAYPWVAVCRVCNVSVGAGSVCERRSVQRKLQQCIRARVSDVHVRSRRCAVRAVCSIRCV